MSFDNNRMITSSVSYIITDNNESGSHSRDILVKDNYVLSTPISNLVEFVHCVVSDLPTLL